MKSLKTLTSRSLVVINCLLLTCVVQAGQPPPCEDQLVVSVTDMYFGTIITGITGTIVMSPTGAMVDSPLGIIAGSTTGTPIIFNLSIGNSCKNRNVTFVMPSSFTISNLSGSPATSFTISALTSDLPTNPFRVSDVPTIRVGGTLTISTTTAPEAPYSGGFAFDFLIP